MINFIFISIQMKRILWYITCYLYSLNPFWPLHSDQFSSITLQKLKNCLKVTLDIYLAKRSRKTERRGKMKRKKMGKKILLLPEIEPTTSLSTGERSTDWATPTLYFNRGKYRYIKQRQFLKEFYIFLDFTRCANFVKPKT